MAGRRKGAEDRNDSSCIFHAIERVPLPPSYRDRFSVFSSHALEVSERVVLVGLAWGCTGENMILKKPLCLLAGITARVFL